MSLRNPLLAVRRCGNQLFETGREFRSISSADFSKERLDLRKDADVLAVAVIEELHTDCSVVDESCCHIPIGDDHPKIATLRTKDGGIEVFHRLWMKLPKIPVACLAHRVFTAQFVQFKN